MEQYILVGLVSGSIYAIAALGLVSTYVASGVLNFAYGAFAFFAARFFYYLNTQHHWDAAAAGVVVILLFSPVAGLFLWAVILRGLSRASTLLKVAATIGLAVALPALAQVTFGITSIFIVPGLVPAPVPVYNVVGASITLNQVIVLACLAAILAGGAMVLRFTSAGLVVRALVDSERMTVLSGVSPQPVGAAVWAISFTLCGLAGVLIAPTFGLSTSNSFTLLVATAFAAVILAELRHPGRAVLAALAIGVVTSLVQKFASSSAQDLVPAVPFAFVFVFVLVRSKWVGEVRSEHENELGLRLARVDEYREDRPPPGTPAARRLMLEVRSRPALIVITAAVLVAPALLSTYWVGLFGGGVAFAVAFLSLTLLTGESGFISLAQVSFAGVGAFAVGQLATLNGLPVLAALVIAGAVAFPAGLVVGALIVRLNDLYVALITLTFALLMDNLVFNQPHFQRNGLGIVVNRPGFVGSPEAFAYLALVVFFLVALFLVNLRRSTSGLAISATRWSNQATRTLGIGTVRVRVLVVGLGASIAALGGGLLAMYDRVAQPGYFSTSAGLIWVAVAVAVGIRRIGAALAAGLAFTIVPGLFNAYLPGSWTPVPTILFGLAAIGMVRQPDGIATDVSVQLKRLRRAVLAPRRAGPAPRTPDGGAGEAAPVTIGRGS